jgi:toxin secretion/phage lysis holin
MKVIDTYNAILGAAVAVLSYVLGPHWFLFAIFLLLNVFDWITGWIKSKKTGKTSSKAGLWGIMKKFGYWMLIIASFSITASFTELGSILGMDLGVTTLLGWFVLASLLVNEARSICENLVEMGINMPTILVKGLQAANRVVNQDEMDDEGE